MSATAKRSRVSIRVATIFARVMWRGRPCNNICWIDCSLIAMQSSVTVSHILCVHVSLRNCWQLNHPPPLAWGVSDPETDLLPTCVIASNLVALCQTVWASVCHINTLWGGGVLIPEKHDSTSVCYHADFGWLELGPMHAIDRHTDVRQTDVRRQTDRRQTPEKSIA